MKNKDQGGTTVLVVEREGKKYVLKAAESNQINAVKELLNEAVISQ